MIRRIELPFKVKKPMLACGADLKGAFAVAQGREAVLVDGFGDLSDPDNFAKYEAAVRKYRKKLGAKLQVIACDLHSDYFSTHFAENFQPDYSRAHFRLRQGFGGQVSVPYKCCKRALCRVQHHEAHIASAIVDGNIKGKVIGVAFDGTGYGSDGNIWGGEFFAGDLKSLKRVAHLEYIPMPGADSAIREPWRMAASYLYRAAGKDFLKPGSRTHFPALCQSLGGIPPSAKCTGRENAPYINTNSLKVIVKMIDGGINSPRTSSAGRLFDAAGSLILSRDYVSKEAELPIELEKLASGYAGCGKYDFTIRKDGENFVIGTASVIKGIVKDLSVKEDKRVMSCKFHNTVADIILKTSILLNKKFRIKQVALSGGVFQNRRLTETAVETLRANGLKVFTHSMVPTNDCGIPVGQIAIANARAVCA